MRFGKGDTVSLSGSLPIPAADFVIIDKQSLSAAYLRGHAAMSRRYYRRQAEAEPQHSARLRHLRARLDTSRMQPLFVPPPHRRATADAIAIDRTRLSSGRSKMLTVDSSSSRPTYLPPGTRLFVFVRVCGCAHLRRPGGWGPGMPRGRFPLASTSPLAARPRARARGRACQS